MEQDTNNISELQSPFEQLREIDADGKEWWSSRKLARVMGYGKYWNFERVIAKAQAWTSQKGYHLSEHFVEITEMAELGSGAVREVTSIRLSRAACMAVAMNADQKKEMVKAAQQYFSSTIPPDVAVKSMESSILMTMADWSALLQRYMDLNNRLLLLDTHTSTRTSSIEIQPFLDYVKSNSKENTHVHAKGRNHWHGSGDV